MTEQLANELDEGRGDEGKWKRAAVDIEVKPSRAQVVSFRMPSTEFDEMMQSAEAAGETMSEYIRGAIRLRNMAMPLVQINQLTGSLSSWSSYVKVGNENPVGESGELVMPPRTVAM